MTPNFLFDLDPFTKRPRRYIVRPVRLSRHPGIEQALVRLKQTIDALPREGPQSRRANGPRSS